MSWKSVDSSAASAKCCTATLNRDNEILVTHEKESGEHTISGFFIFFSLLHQLSGLEKLEPANGMSDIKCPKPTEIQCQQPVLEWLNLFGF